MNWNYECFGWKKRDVNLKFSPTILELFSLKLRWQKWDKVGVNMTMGRTDLIAVQNDKHRKLRNRQKDS
jgi:hypothetical protein